MLPIGFSPPRLWHNACPIFAKGPYWHPNTVHEHTEVVTRVVMHKVYLAMPQQGSLESKYRSQFPEIDCLLCAAVAPRLCTCVQLYPCCISSSIMTLWACVHGQA